jgi:LmbE family N-acetylglucosaminyl deacetylase
MRAVVEEALRLHRPSREDALELWTFEGAWHQHAASEIDVLLRFDAAAEATKLAAVRAHQSQIRRVPFDEGAVALARLRGVAFSESRFGGVEGLREVPLVEAYRREAW